MLQDREWHELYRAVKKACGFEGTVWRTDSDQMFHWEVRRHRPDPEFRRFNMTYSQRVELPHDGPIHEAISRMHDELMEAVLELPWEEYFDAPKKPSLHHRLLSDTIMSEEEVRKHLADPNYVWEL